MNHQWKCICRKDQIQLWLTYIILDLFVLQCNAFCRKLKCNVLSYPNVILMMKGDLTYVHKCKKKTCKKYINIYCPFSREIDKNLNVLVYCGHCCTHIHRRQIDGLQYTELYSESALSVCSHSPVRAVNNEPELLIRMWKVY